MHKKKKKKTQNFKETNNLCIICKLLLVYAYGAMLQHFA
jgi:hypothetical protein